MAEEIPGHTYQSGSTSVDCRGNGEQTWFMPSSEEVRRLAELTDRLVQRFPAISAWTIATIVHEVHHGFDGRPMREFVPLLVERGAARQLVSALR
ncbi:three-helix bundle dimerization domain-containing protein [Nocardia sp. CA-151230]|uniref:three-helix bundle dimerization domain-containing protein n=1 Tax=Nocardia sp. CA-151230 TaxID=3239982 RepID=UPI003D8B9C33